MYLKLYLVGEKLCVLLRISYNYIYIEIIYFCLYKYVGMSKVTYIIHFIFVVTSHLLVSFIFKKIKNNKEIK